MIWEFTMAKIYSAADFRKYFDTALEERKQNALIPSPFLIKNKMNMLGCTRFGNVDFKNKKIEIGWTWIDQNCMAQASISIANFYCLVFALKNYN